MREVSDSTIVMDNDSFLDNNPELSQLDCFAITNNAIVEVITSIYCRHDKAGDERALHKQDKP